MKKIIVCLLSLAIITSGFIAVKKVVEISALMNARSLGLLVISEKSDADKNMKKAKKKVKEQLIIQIKMHKDTMIISNDAFQKLYEKGFIWNKQKDEIEGIKIKEKQTGELFSDNIGNILLADKKQRQVTISNEKYTINQQMNYLLGDGQRLTENYLIVSSDVYSKSKVKEYTLLALVYKDNPKFDLELYEYEKIQLTTIDNES